MKRLLICYEKHFNRYFDASTPELKYQSSLMILKGRMDDTYHKWYEHEDAAVKSHIRMILASQNGAMAFWFLCSRKENEYERIDLVKVDTTY